MPTPAHTDFDSANPQGSQTRAAFATSTLNGLRALRDAITNGRLEGFVQSIAQGSGADLDHPQFITWLNATLLIGFRWNITWTGHQLTSVADEWSNDNGATWTAINTAQANTYDASNRITSSTQAGGWRTMFFQVWTQLLKIKADFATHAAATGAAVHGLASMAIQAANNILVTGGFMDGVIIGDTTAVRATFACVRYLKNDYTPLLNAGVTLDWGRGAATITTNGTNAITMASLPPVGDITVFVDHFNNVTWPGAVSWGTPGIPSIPGPAYVGLLTTNTGASIPAVVIWF